jgi:DNA-binding MarR family transcriptional regulator
MCQLLTGAFNTDGRVAREPQADPAAADAGLAASRTMVAMNSPAEVPAGAQHHRALWLLMSRGSADLAGALGVAQSPAGRMCGRLARKGLIRRHRATGDRRTIRVSLTTKGRQVADETAARHAALVTDILDRLPAPARRAISQAFLDFADAADEGPGSQWPESASAQDGHDDR